jgi:hypothetical protein
MSHLFCSTGTSQEELAISYFSPMGCQNINLVLRSIRQKPVACCSSVGMWGDFGLSKTYILTNDRMNCLINRFFQTTKEDKKSW